MRPMIRYSIAVLNCSSFSANKVSHNSGCFLHRSPAEPDHPAQAALMCRPPQNPISPNGVAIAGPLRYTCLSGPTTRYEIRKSCLLYTSDAADEEDSVDLGGRRVLKKK
eukprot:TRINITY_DN28510_c0_g1_i1.p1 TRINITY_DN28510_c0_g1~~TRINITY_DN28510_c0_g1_i1.p1  ORF type:complete len:109 (-),score=16.89 TRINITY_DN28510_c0_g1_i1:35-361(-)